MTNTFEDQLINSINDNYRNAGFVTEAEEYTEEEYMVPMRDGIRLITFVFKPNNGQNKFHVVLNRSGYANDERINRTHAENMAKLGYAYVVQYCRGIFKSEGEWVPNINERNDGIDTVNWLCSQQWVEQIGYAGLSYGALNGWAMADAVEGKVTSMYLEHYGTDRFCSAYEKGLFRHDVLTGWTMRNAGFPIEADYFDSCKFEPHCMVDEKLWGKRIDWYHDYIENPDINAEFWQSGWWKELREIPAKCTIPLCIISGWYDHHHGSTMKTWERLNPASKNQSHLVIGGWNHFSLPIMQNREEKNIENNSVKRMLQWFELTLKQGIIPKREISLYNCGKDEWEKYEDWNLDGSDKNLVQYKLDIVEGNKTLVKNDDNHINKSNYKKAISFTYDPYNPVPTHGGEALLASFNEIGSLVQPVPDYRDDVVSFISDELDEMFEIQGKIKVHLKVSTNVSDTSFSAKVMEIAPDGTAYNIRSSITTLQADLPKGEHYIPGSSIEVNIEMWDIFYTIPAGSKIRIDISSSDFPAYSIHRNRSGVWSKQVGYDKAEQTIYVDGSSYVEFFVK